MLSPTFAMRFHTDRNDSLALGAMPTALRGHAKHPAQHAHAKPWARHPTLSPRLPWPLSGLFLLLLVPVAHADVTVSGDPRSSLRRTHAAGQMIAAHGHNQARGG